LIRKGEEVVREQRERVKGQREELGELAERSRNAGQREEQPFLPL
jgi:hypothetical protein